VRLELEHRQNLLAGKLVELTFPERPALRQDGVYAIQNERGTNQGQLRVLVIRKVVTGWVAVTRLEADPVRLLAKGGGYTDFPGRAMDPQEPEAVDEDTQTQITKEARIRDTKRKADTQQTALDEEAQRLRSERNSLEARLSIARKVAEVRGVDISPSTRVIERQLARIERQLQMYEKDVA
jgi:hypothetical protein